MMKQIKLLLHIVQNYVWINDSKQILIKTLL